MQTRKSIKAIFVLTGIIATVMMARLFFVLMFNFYKEGTTTTVKSFLQDAAQLSEEHYSSEKGILILPKWGKFPEDFREAISQPPTELEEMKKGVLQTPRLHSPDTIYYVLLTQSRSGKQVYVGKRLDWSVTGVMIGNYNLMIYWRAYALSILFAGILTALLLFVLKFVVTPLESLKIWAETISGGSGNNKNPDIKFRFKEFADIADVISVNIERQRSAIRKEQEFLKFSSHELRTPLAVMKANTELLSRLSRNHPEKERRVISRIAGATNTMTGTINTFLWLSRDESLSTPFEKIDLSEMVSSVVDESRYLLANKPVEIIVNTESCETSLPEVPARIMVSNIISNAFKHASAGEILIKQPGSKLLVANDNPDIQENETNNTGFGLGLRLVEKIAVRYDWKVNINRSEGLFVVEVNFQTGSRQIS